MAGGRSAEQGEAATRALAYGAAVGRECADIPVASGDPVGRVTAGDDGPGAETVRPHEHKCAELAIALPKYFLSRLTGLR